MRITGKVKFFNKQRGFGFLDVDSKDYFVHISDVEGENLLGGELVEFKPVEGHKGLQAIEIVRLDPPVMKEETGVVHYYDESKGYGFISREGKADVFAHFTDFEDIEDSSEIQKGLHVRFEVRNGREGRDRAYHIKKA